MLKLAAKYETVIFIYCVVYILYGLITYIYIYIYIYIYVCDICRVVYMSLWSSGQRELEGREM